MVHGHRPVDCRGQGGDIPARGRRATCCCGTGSGRCRRRDRRRRSSGRWRGSGRRTGSGHGPGARSRRGRRSERDGRQQRDADRGREGAAVAGPSGAGWIIQLKGYHFHNTYPGKPELDFTNDEGKEFIENTFFKSLEEGTVQLPDGPNGELVEVPIPKLGIQFPVVTTENPIVSVNYYPEATDGETGAKLMSRGPDMGIGGRGDEPAPPKMWKLRRYDFTIQFFWKQTPRSVRQAPPATAEGEESLDTVSVDGGAGPTG